MVLCIKDVEGQIECYVFDYVDHALVYLDESEFGSVRSKKMTKSLR